MNNLEKIGALLGREGRTVVYGVPAAAEVPNLISLSVGEGKPSVPFLGDRGAVCYPSIKVSVYAENYLEGYRLLLAVTEEMRAVIKSTIQYVFRGCADSTYDSALQRHVITAVFEEIKL